MSWQDIPGFSGFLWLYDQAVEEAPQSGAVFVEVGVALGHSIAYLARKVIDSGKDIEIWAVDPWAGHARNGEQQEALGKEPSRGDFTLFLRTMLEHAPEELERIKIFRTTSDQASDLFQDYEYMVQHADLVLIDAAHDYQSVLDDIGRWIGAIRPGGILAGDDHEPNYPGVEKACRKRLGHEYKVEGTTWWTRIGTPTRMGAKCE